MGKAGRLIYIVSYKKDGSLKSLVGERKLRYLFYKAHAFVFYSISRIGTTFFMCKCRIVHFARLLQ